MDRIELKKELHENKIISIGHIGLKRCYLNVEQKEAIRRYCKSQGLTLQQFKEYDISIDIIEFDDEFGAYSIYEECCD